MDERLFQAVCLEVDGYDYMTFVGGQAKRADPPRLPSLGRRVVDLEATDDPVPRCVAFRTPGRRGVLIDSRDRKRTKQIWPAPRERVQPCSEDHVLLMHGRVQLVFRIPATGDQRCVA